MFKKFLRICSTILTLVMLINMLPLNAWAVGSISESSLELSANDTVTSGEQTDIDLSNAWIVEEVTANRTEYSKEFKLNNGLYVAAVYPQAVHYETATGWEEIDNTLKANLDGTYSNTAGTWDVRFPQQLSGSKDITITKDGYTLSFRMAGELRQQPNVSVYAVQSAAPAETFQITVDGTAQTFAVQSAQTAQAQIQAIDLTQAKAEAQYAEFVLDKNASQLLYANVYANTNIRYDLHANRVKESVILASYSSTLRGYRYTLNTGGMIPVLQKDNSIHFYDAKQENVVMVMPAPFLVDANDQYNYDVKVTLTGSGSSYTLIYTLPNAWLADTDRAWPVVLDPEVTSQPDVLNIRDHTVASNGSYSMYRQVLECGYGPSNHIHHIYLKYRELPALRSSDVIIDATIQLLKKDNTSNGDVDIEVHKVLGTWESETITWANKPGHNPLIEDLTTIEDGYRYYTWNVTDIVREWYAGTNTGMMFKASDETEADGGSSWKHFYSSDCLTTEYMPSLTITFRNNNGLEDYWDYTATSAGRAGTGYVNNYTGNLVWVRPDMGFDNNLMPVYINHIYNANDGTRNDFGLGKGWRTNYNQLVYQMEGDSNYYIWEDADGTKHHFKYNSSTNNYKNEENLRLTLATGVDDFNNTEYVITDLYGNTSSFDSAGRLVRQTNNQKTPSSITITYDGSTKRISTITDGISRVYRFTYTNSMLSRLSCYNSSGVEITYATYTYSNSQLTKITDKDAKSVTYGYGSNGLLQTVQNVDGIKLTYTYNTIEKAYQPYRVSQIKETDNGIEGGELNIVYANNQTTFTDVGGNVQVMQFNNFGNTISVQDGNGNAQTSQYTNNDALGSSTAPANQLALASQLQTTVANMFKDSSFENGTKWTVTDSTVTQINMNGGVYSGFRQLYIYTTVSNTGITSASFTAKAGQSYTFSAYVLTTSAKVHLSLSDGTTTVRSETLDRGTPWTRLQVTYKNTADSAKTITAQCIASTAGIFYLDCVQLENAESANRYNLIENGDFRYGVDGWTNTGGYTAVNLASAAVQLDNNAYSVTGSPTSQKRLTQTVNISGGAGDIYTLTGWAKGDSAPWTGARQFGIYATINYTDNTSKMFVAEFNKDEDSVNSWQYSAVELVASKEYSSITVAIAYDFNVNTAYFDGIQLYKEALGATYKYDSRGNIKEIRDVLGQITTYSYNIKDQLIQETRPSEEVITYTYDSYYNVKTITSSFGTVQEYTYTDIGNCALIKTTMGDVVTEEEYTYTADGKEFLQSKKTSLGKELFYDYDQDTGLLMQVTDNETDNETDNLTIQTDYEYDSMGRLISETVSSNGSDPSVTYVYQDDLLSTAQTASTLYTFTYGNFSQISSIKAGSHTLATYHYNDETTDDRKNDLDRIDYGNGHRVEYKYDDQGRVIEEIYSSENGWSGNEGIIYYTYNRDGSLASIYDDYDLGVKYAYSYDSFGRVVQVRSGNQIISSYEYNELNQLTSFVDTVYGTKEYTYAEDRLDYEDNGHHQKDYTYYAGGMLQKAEVTDGSRELVEQSYVYYTDANPTQIGMLKEYHIDGGPYSVNYSYTYDNRGNITSIDDGTYTTSYVYDGTNQLVRENNQREGKTWVWEYDNAGNILCKKEYGYTTGTLSGQPTTINYTYGDSSWGDLLTGYGNYTIQYDEIGNPLNDGRRTYTWERGRRVASINGASMYYDSDGMLIEQYAGDDWYGYTYRDGRLVRLDMFVENGDYSFIFEYDASGAPISLKCTAWYSASNTSTTTTYYYMVNPQGDVLGLVDSDGYPVVTYWYDAWGKEIDKVYSSGISQTDRDVADLNPLRYRGYIYDVESGLYYLKSRFYDPEVGRFINADEFVSTGQDLQGYNMFAYCGNNPVVRMDPNGKLWGAICIGFIAGLVGQYISDVIENVQSGKTGADVFVPTSSISDYLASGAGGAIAAIPGLNFVGTMAVGAVGNVVSDAFKGNINSLEDLGKSIIKGAVANGIGYGVAKGMATLKVNQISNMPRSSRKVYLRDHFYCNSQANANVNLKTFANSSLSDNIRIVETQLAIFRSGVYSTITSTFATLF